MAAQEQELNSEIGRLLLRQKETIVQGLVDGAVEGIKRDLGWRAGNIAAATVDEFVKTEVIPELNRRLQEQKAEVVEALLIGVHEAIKTAGEKLAEAAAKNLSQSWNVSKLAEALFK
jgi:hypothetical protein